MLLGLWGSPVISKVLANLGTGKVRSDLLPAFAIRLSQESTSQGVDLIHNGIGNFQFASPVGRFVFVGEFRHHLANELVSGIVSFASK